MTTPNSLPFPPSPDDGDIVIRGDLIGVYHQDINTWALSRLKEAPTLKLNVVESWSAKAWPANSLVTYKNQEYYSLTPVVAGDPAPDATGSAWKNISKVHFTRDLADVDVMVPSKAGHILVWDGKKYVPGPVVTKVYTLTSKQLFNQVGATTPDKLNTIYPILNKAIETPATGTVVIVSHSDPLHVKLEGAWYYDGKTWLQGGGAGGGGSTTEQHFRGSTTDTQKAGSFEGDIDIVTEKLHAQLNVFDGTNWQPVFHEETIKQWIAAGSLFQGVRDSVNTGGDTIASLPAPDTTNKGFYWSWTGAPGTSIVPADFANGGGFTATLQVGDWVQSDGAKYVHVPSDLLSKLRWNSLGSFQPWSDTNWEAFSLVTSNNKMYRASAAITTGDAAPGAVGSKWTDITPSAKLEDLSDVDVTTTLPTDNTVLLYDQLNAAWIGGKLPLSSLKDVNANVDSPYHGQVFQWDDNVGEWVASDTLTIGAIKFDDSGLQPEVNAFTDAIDYVDPVDAGSTVPTVQAVKDYVKDYVKDNPPFLEELDDCKELAKAEDGQTVVWNNTTNRWEPKYLTSPIIFLGNGAWDATLVGDKTQNYGMPTGTHPDPKVWMPQPGDQYIDLATGDITLFS